VAHPEVKGVCAGAVLSDYQRLRVEHVCARLGLQSLAYLWQRDQDDLVQEMVEIGTVAVLIKVAAIGLAPQKHLGKSLAQMLPTLRRLHSEYDVHVAGEGGEYETLTLDMPLFHSRVVLEETEVVVTDEDPFAPVGYLRVIRAHLEPKKEASRPPIDPDARTALSQRLLFGTLECPKERVYVETGAIFPEAAAVPSAGNDADTLEDSVARTTLDLLPCVTGGSTADARSYALAENEAEMAMELEEAASSLLTRLKARLREDGLALADVRHVNLSVADMAAFGQVNRVYLDFFGQEPPSRVCVELPLGARRLLLECLVISPDVCPTPPAHMHVQGISYWAPANIGPYSQAVKVRDMVEAEPCATLGVFQAHVAVTGRQADRRTVTDRTV
jgi:diphthine-ammonia ligase